LNPRLSGLRPSLANYPTTIGAPALSEPIERILTLAASLPSAR
jgi:hypothetical protein